MTIEVREYEDADKDDWEDFVKGSNNGTIFHSLKFLSYHPKDKYNEHHLIFEKKGRIISILPAAIIEKKRLRKLCSPYGASYGSFVVPTSINLKDSISIVKQLLDYCEQLDIESIHLTPPPSIYYKEYNNYLDFALIKNGFRYTKRELTSVIVMNYGDPINSFNRDAKRSVMKSKNLGISVSATEDYSSFYEILLENKKKFEVLPTHSLEDLLRLKKIIPQNLKLFLAYIEEKPIAGVLIFICNSKTILAFYISQFLEYKKYRANNLLIYEIIKWGIYNNFEYFDLGTSTMIMEPHWSLIQFKESVNSKGYFRDSLSYRFIRA
jgi:hypothetical protein